ncbi:MAG: nucleotidyltransferase domain-containing protein [Armatimonadetes bacterium]|nr:nucleotidyltransferase domain-containing protein [Armatimonadota bacterium]
MKNIRLPPHDRLTENILRETASDRNIVGVMIQGSVARGDAYPLSDLDLFFLLADGASHRFDTRTESSIVIECHALDFASTVTKLTANPMLAWGFVDGRILRDEANQLPRLVQIARYLLDNYETPRREWDGLFYWLRSAEIKISAAVDGGDLLKASFVSTTTMWKVLEAVWAVNRLPIPPSGAVLAHRHELRQVPENWQSLFDALFLGDMVERVEAMRTIIVWLLTTHNADASDAIPE